MSDTAAALKSDNGALEAAEAEPKKAKTEEEVVAPALADELSLKPTGDTAAPAESASEEVFGVFLFCFFFSFLLSCTGGGPFNLSMPSASASAPPAPSALPKALDGFVLAAGGGLAKHHLYVVEGHEPLVLEGSHHTFYTGYQGHSPSGEFSVPFLPAGVCIRDPRSDESPSFHVAGFIGTRNHTIFIIGLDENGKYVLLPLPSSNSTWCQSPTVDSPPKTGEDLQLLQKGALEVYSSHHSSAEWKLKSDLKESVSDEKLGQGGPGRRDQTLVHTHDEYVNLQEQLDAHKQAFEAANKEIADLKVTLKAQAPALIILDDKNAGALVDQIVQHASGPLRTAMEEIVRDNLTKSISGTIEALQRENEALRGTAQSLQSSLSTLQQSTARLQQTQSEMTAMMMPRPVPPTTPPQLSPQPYGTPTQYPGGPLPPSYQPGWHY